MKEAFDEIYRFNGTDGGVLTIEKTDAMHVKLAVQGCGVHLNAAQWYALRYCIHISLDEESVDESSEC